VFKDKIMGNKKGIETQMLIFVLIAVLVLAVLGVAYLYLHGDLAGLWQKIINAMRFWH